MSKLIRERGGGYITIPEGTLYPTLYKIEDKELISSYKKQTGKRSSRVYYHIEETGKKYLEELLLEFYSVYDAIKRIIEFEEVENE